MWPRANGVYVYIPAGPGGSEDAPNDFYQRVRDLLIEAGMDEPSWTYRYNAGANPIAFSLPRERVAHSAVRTILTEAYELA